MKGMPKSPLGKQYIFYMSLHGVGMKNLMKVSAEIIDRSNLNYILCTKSEASDRTIVEHLSTNVYWYPDN